MLSKGFSRNPRELPISSEEVPATKGDQRWPWTDGGAVVRPHSTREGGEPQGPARGGHGIHWREGGNIRTPRFGDTWRHAALSLACASAHTSRVDGSL